MRRLTFITLILLMSVNCLALQKNVASQKWIVFAFDRTDNTVKTGDAAQITANLRIDGVQNAVDDTNPTELEDGYYEFGITAAESNGDNIVICPASSSSNIIVIGCPQALWTTPPYFPTMSIDSNGRLDIIMIAGTTQTANDMSGDINTILTDTEAQDTTTEIRTLMTGSDTTVATQAKKDTIDNYIDSEISTIVTAVGNIETDTAAQDTAGEWDTLMATVDGKLDTAQADLDTITGASGVLIDTDAVDADALKTDFVTEIWSIAMTDMAAAAPSVTAAANTALNWLYTAWRNGYKTDGTNSEIVLYKDDGTTPLVESDIADDGTDFTRQEWGAPD